MSDQPYFEDVVDGDEIPGLSLAISRVQMFFFSAATYNGHRIHYDQAWAREVEGYPDILVHGPLQVALIGRVLTDWIGPDGRLVRLSIQNRASAYAEELLRFRAFVISRREEGGRGLVDLAVRGERSDNEVLMPGTATVCLPRRC